MRSLTSRRVAVAGVALSAVLGLAGCTASAPADSSTGAAGSTGDGGAALPIDQLCGDQPIKIAHVAGFGANSWRKITQAELTDELSACPNVTLDYTQTDGDLQKYITAINSYTAQGYDAIVTYDDFGSQALSALKNAHDAGVVVVPYIADPGGTVGTDYDGYVQYDFDTEGDTMAQWLHAQVEPGAEPALQRRPGRREPLHRRTLGRDLADLRRTRRRVHPADQRAATLGLGPGLRAAGHGRCVDQST